MQEICRKDQLARIATRLQKRFLGEYDFFPYNWIMPYDWTKFQRHHKSQTRTITGRRRQCYISKPDHGCQGKGIFLFKNLEDLKAHKDCEVVVQSYISNPCLIDGFKFDFRVYVLVTSVDPLRVFVYDDGLARFATERYQPPSQKNLDRVCMHLTNYAVNKNSTHFIRNDGGQNSSKRSIQSVLQQLEETKRIDKDGVWKRIEQVVVKTVMAVQPQLCKTTKAWFPTDPNASLHHLGSQCFEILGFDIMLDSDMKPWVLEVNHSPSFTCDSPLDTEIKSKVVEEALHLLFLNPNTRRKHQQDQKRQSLSRLVRSTGATAAADYPVVDVTTANETFKKTSSMAERKDSFTTIVDQDNLDPMKNYPFLKNYHKLYNPALLQKLTEYEDSRMSKYKRVFPPENLDQLEKYLSLIQNVTGSTNSMVARQKQYVRKGQQHEQSREKNKYDEKALRKRQQRKNAEAAGSISSEKSIAKSVDLNKNRMVLSVPNRSRLSLTSFVRQKNTIPVAVLVSVQTINDHVLFSRNNEPKVRLLPNKTISLPNLETNRNRNSNLYKV
jgi:hypothetical protein